MSEFHDGLDEGLKEFIRHQSIFVVASATAGGRVNASPKGSDTFRVLDDRRVAYLDLTGSGNETAAHLLADGRITFMFMSFDKKPLILRLYGNARLVQPADADWGELVDHFPEFPGTRQIIDASVESVQTSCGFNIPLFEMKAPRETLQRWSAGKGKSGLAAYWAERNLTSIDGLPTGMKFDRRGTNE